MAKGPNAVTNERAPLVTIELPQRLMDPPDPSASLRPPSALDEQLCHDYQCIIQKVRTALRSNKLVLLKGIPSDSGIVFNEDGIFSLRGSIEQTVVWQGEPFNADVNIQLIVCGEPDAKARALVDVANLDGETPASENQDKDTNVLDDDADSAANQDERKKGNLTENQDKINEDEEVNSTRRIHRTTTLAEFIKAGNDPNECGNCLDLPSVRYRCPQIIR